MTMLFLNTIEWQKWKKLSFWKEICMCRNLKTLFKKTLHFFPNIALVLSLKNVSK